MYASGPRQGFLWWLRSRLSESGRVRLRRLSDPVLEPIGSVRGARTRDPLVALTFDDGPDPESTPGVLDVLARHGARATWFVLVDRAEANPKLIRRILAEGHELGLHGADHRRLTTLNPRELRPHIERAARRLGELVGRPPRLFRPPYGAQSLRSYIAARRCGMDVVVWSVDCEDWEQHQELDIATRGVRAAQPGGIVLLHDSLAADPATPVAAPILDRPKIADLLLLGLAERGLQAVSVSALLQGRRAHRTAWFRP
jgi:peptidoglycan/xylan/chitin deacetylase (PgdA/CDA1 family)